MPKNRHPEYQYLDLLSDIMENGEDKISHSTNESLRSVFGRQNRYDLSQGFPLLTTKKMFIRGIIHELIWFLSGSPNISYLVKNEVHIWDDWAYELYLTPMKAGKAEKLTLKEFAQKIKEDDKFAQKWGNIGPVYGVQWRNWDAGNGETIDQLKWFIDKVKQKPLKKHYIISAWNPAKIYEMAPNPDQSMMLAPCHTFYHILISGDKLNLQLYQRSADMFLGVPFNIASYALLTMVLAQVTGYKPGEFVHTFGDAHIYHNQFEVVKKQLRRKPRPFPSMKINAKVTDIDKLRYEDFTLEGYDPHPGIKSPGIVVVKGRKDLVKVNSRKAKKD